MTCSITSTCALSLITCSTSCRRNSRSPAWAATSPRPRLYTSTASWAGLISSRWKRSSGDPRGAAARRLRPSSSSRSGEVGRSGRYDAVLTGLLGALERRAAGLELGFQGQLALGYEARHAGTDGEIPPVAVTWVMDQQVPHPLSDDLRVLRSLLRRIALSQRRKRPSLPTADEVAATPVGGADDARHPPDTRVPCVLIESVVVGCEVVYVEERQGDLVRVALREHPVALQQLLEVGARVQSRQPVLAQPRGYARGCLLIALEPLAGIAVVSNEVS